MKKETTNDSKQQEAWLNEKIPFYAFKDDGKYKDDIVVIVNGKTWQIKRGYNVMIPRFVAMAIDNAAKQAAESANWNEKLIAEYERRRGKLE